MVARRILAFDFEVTTIIFRNHLSIKSVWAKRINYFREKSFDFFIQYLLDIRSIICGINVLESEVGDDASGFIRINKTVKTVTENI